MDEVRERVNARLPDQFRVLDVVRTTRNFCAKTQRDRVRYQYMIPSFALCDVSILRSMFEKAGCVNNGRPATDPLSPDEVAELQRQLVGFRSTTGQLDRLREALELYAGTHPFHNFSKGVSSDEDRASRYIVSFHVEEPVVFPNGMEWIPTQVLGQSFLIHQIRKMVSLAVDVARGAAPVQTISRALSKETNLRLNTAPSQGLFLEMSFYSGYNRRKQSNPELRDIDWDDETTATHERWKEFRKNVVMRHIVEEELKEANFLKYLYVQEYVFEYPRFYQL